MRGILLVGLTLFGAAASASPPEDEQHLFVSARKKVIGYGCFVNTTPSCPQTLANTTTPYESVGSRTQPVDAVINPPIGQVALTATQTSTQLDLSGFLHLAASNLIDCVVDCGGPYPLIVTQHSGLAIARAEAVFRLDEPGSMILSGTIDLATQTYDLLLGYQMSDPPVGSYLIEVGPKGGAPTQTFWGTVTDLDPDVSVSLAEVVPLSAGVHFVRIRFYADVGVELFPGAAGFFGSDMAVDFAVSAQVPNGALLPSSSLATQFGLIGCLLVAGAGALVARQRTRSRST